jgi:serine/threonine protein kinase
MGTVYRAAHAETGHVVAVKVLAARRASDPLHLRRFEQEYAAASRLRHPHIVQGLSFGLEQGRPYFVMEHVAGPDLAQYVQQRGALREAEAVRLALQVADALQLAHAHNLIHRDVKPENIVLTPAGQAKLTDLGLVKDLDAVAELTRSRTCLGSTDFMAPEQFEDAKHADTRCDVYGLAATLYYALTATVPFPGRGNLSILWKKLQNDFLPPSHHVPSLSAQVDQAICKSLDAEPDRRPRSCRDFMALLTSVLPPEARVSPSPPAPARKEQRAAPRYPTDFTAFCCPLQGNRRPWQAAVQELSRTGLRLQMERRFEPGTILGVEVTDPVQDATVTWLVQVRWVRETAEKQWQLGCSFHRELCEDDLRTYCPAQFPRA